MMWLVYSLAILVAAVRGEDATINLMFMSSGGGQYNSSGAEPAVDLAVKLINENEVIPGYQLNIATRGNSSVSERFLSSSLLVICVVYTAATSTIITALVIDTGFCWNS